MQLIKLIDYKKSPFSVDELNKDLNKILTKRIFDFKSLKEIQFEALKLINETKDVKNNKVSIKKSIQIVLEHFKLYPPVKVSVTNLITNKKVENVISSLDEDFNKFILNLERTPYESLLEIKPKVEEDLKCFNELIKRYESYQDIVNLLSGNRVYNSESNSKIYFYKKSLEERQLILDYYIEGMYDWAIIKSRPNRFPKFSVYSLVDLNHKPYNFRRRIFELNFDSEKLDCVTHRLLLCEDLQLSEFLSKKKMYEESKENFYEFFFKKIPLKILISQIIENLNVLPLTENRKSIILKGISCFKKRDWLSFFSIMLPQIEGLFSEIIDHDFTDKSSKSSLSIKVNKIRNNVEYLETTLDYFQYELPKLRNRFAHGAIIEDLKFYSYDLITDLADLFQMFLAVNKPVVNVSKTIRIKRQTYFYDLNDYTNFFESINNLKPKELKELYDEIIKFTEETIFKLEEYLADILAKEIENFKTCIHQLNNQLIVLDFKNSINNSNMFEEIESKESSLIKEIYSQNIGLFVSCNVLNCFYNNFKFFKKKFIKTEFLKIELNLLDGVKNSFRNIMKINERFDQDNS